MAVPPAFMNVARVPFDDVRPLDLTHVVIDVAELDPPEPLQRGAVRIAFLVGERVMLAMDRHPLSRREPGDEPEDEAECPFEAGMDDQGFVRGGSMQVDRRAEHGRLNEDGRDDEREDERKKHYCLLPKPGPAVALITQGSGRGELLGTGDGSTNSPPRQPRTRSNSFMNCTRASIPDSGNAL